MGNQSVLFLALLYLFVLFVYIFIEIYIIKIYKQTNIFMFLRWMYAIIYGLIPVIAYYSYYKNGEIYYSIHISQEGISLGYHLLILSVVGYLFLNLGYWIIPRKAKDTQYKSTNQSSGIKNLILSGTVIFFIGFVALYLWTKPYGGLFEIIPIASAVRAGRLVVPDSLSFMKQLAPLLMFSAYTFVALIIDNRKSIIVYLMLLNTVFWSIIYMVSNDGRMTFIAFFLIIGLGIFKSKEVESKRFFKRNWKKLVLILILSFYLMSSADQIMDYVRYGEFETNDRKSIIQVINKELSYTIKSGQLALTSYYNGDSGNRILIDIKNGLLAPIPRRLIPEYMQDISLYEYNSALAGARHVIPTDLLAMCIYDMGYIGIIIIPFLFGLIISKIETNLNKKQGIAYYNMLYGLLALTFISIIGYADLEVISRGFIYILIGHVIVIIFGKVKLIIK